VLEEQERRRAPKGLAYLEDPGGWKPRTVERPSAGENRNGAAFMSTLAVDFDPSIAGA
jgi:hypothetical protein